MKSQPYHGLYILRRCAIGYGGLSTIEGHGLQEIDSTLGVPVVPAVVSLNIKWRHCGKHPMARYGWSLTMLFSRSRSPVRQFHPPRPVLAPQRDRHTCSDHGFPICSEWNRSNRALKGLPEKISPLQEMT